MTIIRNFITGLSVVFFILSSIITIKASNIPVTNVDDRRYSQGMKSEVDLPGKDQLKNHEREEVTKDNREALNKIEKSRKEVDLLKGKREEQKVIQYNNKTSGVTNSVEKGLEPENDRAHEQKENNIDNSNISGGTRFSDNQKAFQIIYTIQTGSFLTIDRAQKQFDLLAKGVVGRELNYLRIEKVGKFYSVRLGKFSGYAAAVRLLQTINPQLADAIILETTYSDDKIMRLFQIIEKPIL